MVSLFVCGDIINYTRKNDDFISDDLCKVIRNADYSVCNFEAPIHNSFSPAKKSGIHHSQLEITVDKLKNYGFDLLALANNHAMDYDFPGLEKTINKISEVGLEHIGAGENFHIAYKPLIKEFGELKVAFINAAELQYGALHYHNDENTPGYAWINHHNIDKMILELRKECDFIVVLAHAGLEHYSTPQFEWRIRYQQLCDLGADMIIASHPHVPQGYEAYKDSYIFYSLGNFYFDTEKYRYRENRNYSLLIRLEKNKKPIIDFVYHYNNNGVVDISVNEEDILNLNELNMLIGDNYVERNNKIALEVYQNSLKRNLLHSLSAISLEDGLWNNFKQIVKYYLGKNQDNKLELRSHLIRNESYYYAIQRAFEYELQKSRSSNN